jgi:hypothetical protein
LCFIVFTLPFIFSFFIFGVWVETSDFSTSYLVLDLWSSKTCLPKYRS